jgi:NAD(P)-dependent dehydrogenase (short-subunit alcohol dehydrogenase family)
MTWLQQVTGLAAPVDLSGKTALVIGGASGIGAAVVRQLAELGANTIIVGRDPDKLHAMRRELDGVAKGRVHTQVADLAALASVRPASAALCRDFERLDIVIANASVLNPKTRSLTKDGFESTFGVNHLGNAEFLLGLEKPIRAAGGRVVVVASEAHRRAHGFPLDDLIGGQPYNGAIAYARSKLANILFAKELARRWNDVRIYAAHPGGVKTNMMRTAARESGLLARVLVALFDSGLLTPEESARGIVRIAVDPAEDGPAAPISKSAASIPAPPSPTTHNSQKAFGTRRKRSCNVPPAPKHICSITIMHALDRAALQFRSELEPWPIDDQRGLQ